MTLCPWDNWVEEDNNDKGSGKGFKPLIADRVVEMQQMYKSIVGDGDGCYMEADDDQSSNGEIGNK